MTLSSLFSTESHYRMHRPRQSTPSVEASSHSGAELVTSDGRALPLTSSILRAEAGGGLARIVLEQTFENVGAGDAETIHVTCKMPLPADGAVSGYEFTIGARTIKGRVEPKERAREQFEQALLDGRTAALLEQERADIFTQDIGNIPAGATIVARPGSSSAEPMQTNLDVHLPGTLDRDTRAFGQWMAGAEGTIRESLRSFAQVVDVEAIVQEALLRVWQVAPRFVPDGAPNALLRLGIRIAKNLAISEVRRTKSRPVPEEEIEGLANINVNALEPEVADPMLRSVLAKCYELLPAQPRRALDLRLSRAGEADSALAQALSMQKNTFLQNFGRARKLLAECLRKSGVAVDEGLVA